jgi:hypothetical protein
MSAATADHAGPTRQSVTSLHRIPHVASLSLLLPDTAAVTAVYRRAFSCLSVTAFHLGRPPLLSLTVWARAVHHSYPSPALSRKSAPQPSVTAASRPASHNHQSHSPATEVSRGCPSQRLPLPSLTAIYQGGVSEHPSGDVPRRRLVAAHRRLSSRFPSLTAPSDNSLP